MTFAGIMEKTKKIMKRFTLFTLVLCLLQFSGQAQSWGYGFKVGLNTSGVFGPSETDADGNDLESFGTIGGFQVGGLVQLKMNKYYGFQTEVLFSQKGADYKYEGESYKTFTSPIGAILHSTGTRKELIDATNSYISIPLMVYGNITPNLNLSFGAYFDILVSSSATGEIEYEGTLDNGTGDVSKHLVNYTFNYSKDEALETAAATPINVLVGSDNISVPYNEAAYTHWETKDGNYYNPIDYGLMANLGWRFTNGLRFDLRATYGLTDVTNNFYDISSKERDENYELIPRTDFDRSISLQVTLGFAF